ncbi:MAG TPA: ferritin-like domain-containing protein [Bryobacteraceae bacterium]|jgi:Mn-containing catalase|nr:ferritin-like domain-containing protein [Bryobacteraceae bacterium]
MPALDEILVEELQDLLHAENQLVKALPKMAKAARDPKLREAFQTHLEETKGHVERLKQAFELLGAKAKAKPCKGMQGLVEEGQEIIAEGKEKEEAVADLALAGAAQKVEHYEISGYGTLRTVAERAGHTKVAKLLAQTLAEEEKTDKLLTELSAPLLEQASQGEEEEPEEEDEQQASKSRRSSRSGR